MNRFGFGPSEEHQPVTWWRGHPVYAAHFIALVYSVAMVITSLMMFAQVDYHLSWLGFASEAVYRGQVWRIFTYGLPNAPSIGFAFDMVIIVWFGRDVERFFGRRPFLQLYGAIYLIKPLLLTAVGAWLPTAFAGEFGALAVFVAFAALYPDAPMIFGVLAKWAAAIIVGIFTLAALAGRDAAGLLALWATCGYALAFVRYHQGRLELPRFRLPGRRPKLRVLPDLNPQKKAPAATARSESMAEVDELLDKIARSGIGSLSAKERAKLEAARADLLKRGANR